MKLDTLMYADDADFAFSDLMTLGDGANKLRAHFARWSLTFQWTTTVITVGFEVLV